jgi:hypothetical protein
MRSDRIAKRAGQETACDSVFTADFTRH